MAALQPAPADDVELALDGPQAAVEAGGDLLVGLPFQLQQGDEPERLVVQAAEEAAALLDDHRGELGRRRGRARRPASGGLRPGGGWTPSGGI
jgi:hypothetical protein